MRGYQGEDIEIQLPGDLTIRDIDWLAVWCVSFRENFGHVMIPKNLDVPPALGQNQLTVSLCSQRHLSMPIRTLTLCSRCLTNSHSGGTNRYSYHFFN